MSVPRPRTQIQPVMHLHPPLSTPRLPLAGRAEEGILEKGNSYTLKLRFHFLPAHCGHHLNPIEGFWRVMKDCIGAGRCFANLHLLYQRTRQVLMAHQERPIYEFHW